MTRRVCRRYYHYLVLAVLCVAFSILTGRLEPVVLSSFFCFALVFSARTKSEPRLSLQRLAPKTRVFENEPIELRVAIRAETDLPLLEIFQPVPSDSTITEGTNDITTSLRAGEKREYTFSFSVESRRRIVVGNVALRVHSASALVSWEDEYPATSELAVYPRPQHLQSRIHPRHTFSYAGAYASSTIGEGLEFADVREMIPGDRLSRINWKSVARRRKLYVNEFSEERNTDVVMIMDAFSDIGDSECNYLDSSARAVATITHSLLREKNRVGFIEYGYHFDYLLPRTGDRQWYRILEKLTSTNVIERYVWSEVNWIPRKVMPSNSLVIAVTNFLDMRFVEAVMDLSGRGFDVMALIISPLNIVEAMIRRSPDRRKTRELALRVWRLDWMQVVRRFEEFYPHVSIWDVSESLELALGRLFSLQRRRLFTP